MIERLVSLMTHSDQVSILATDAYKLSMAQAGFPLRQETFYLSCRKGGPFYIPLDYAEVVREIISRVVITEGSRAFLQENGYGLTPAMEEAWKRRDEVQIWAAPAGSWVADREPIVTVTGPSFIVSWLEPLVIMLNFQIQVATAYMNGQREFGSSHYSEGAIIDLITRACGASEQCQIEDRDPQYRAAVQERVRGIAASLGFDFQGKRKVRAFEVGLRAASCMRQHQSALQEALDVGIKRTSNLLMAKNLGMTPVGTTGHEHQQRWGNDYDAFTAIRDMRAETPSYLFDTYNVWTGIPDAVRVMTEVPGAPCAVRFDSGDQPAQFAAFLAAEQEHGCKPMYIFEDGYTVERAQEMDRLCAVSGLAPWRSNFGFGGYIVIPEGFDTYSRNKVSAVYKLSKTGSRPTMKFAGSKSSTPGVPVILVNSADPSQRRIAQLGEVVKGYEPLSASHPCPRSGVPSPDSLQTELLTTLLCMAHTNLQE